MRIAIIVAAGDIIGGHGTAAAEIITQMRKDNLAVDIIPINPKMNGILGLCQKFKFIRTIVTEIAYIGSLLRNISAYDVLHIYSAAYWSFILAPLPAVILGKLYKKRVILNYHSGEAQDHFQRNLALIKNTLANVSQVIVPSIYLQRVFAQFGVETHVIANTVDETRFRFKERSPLKPHFISTRNLESLYNIPCTIRAFKLIQKEVPDATLTIIGYGSQEKALKMLVTGLQLNNVVFVGRVEPAAITKYYEENDIMLNASNVDNVPVSILEAFASGIPVVSTAVGGIPELIQDGITGYLCPSNNENVMAEKALSLLRNQENAESIAERAFKYFQTNHTWKAIKPKWLEAYGIKE